MRLAPPKIEGAHHTLDEVVALLNAGPCHQRGWRGQGIRIAIPDSGIGRHPYFEERGYAIERVATLAGMDPARDEQGHGTVSCANALALAPDATVIGVRHGDFSVSALETALAQRPHIVCCSWGWDRDYISMEALEQDNPAFYREVRDMSRVIRSAIEQGTSFVFSGGNGEHAFPASIPECIATGGMLVERSTASTPQLCTGAFESKLFPGRSVPDLCGVAGAGDRGHILVPAPRGSLLEGQNMPLGKTTLGWAITSGSSATAPQIAGIIALMRNANPSLLPHEIKRLLCETARGNTSPEGGERLADAYAACEAARALA